MCFRYKDAGKSEKTDIYFVNILETSQIREKLCHGYLGAIVKLIKLI